MRTKFVILLTVALQFLSLSCSSVSYTDLQEIRTELNLKIFPEQKDYPEADAVVLWEEHDVHAILDDEYNLVTDEEVTRITKLFKNVDRYASVEIPIYSGDELLGIRARTIRPDGSAIELKSDDFHTTTGVGEGYVFYSDEKKVKFTFPDAEKDCILELHYKIHEARPFVEGVWAIQRSIPVLRNIFKLTVPVVLLEPQSRGGIGWTWRYKPYNCSLSEPAVQRDLTTSQATVDQTVTFTWSQNNVPAFKPDPMMGAYSNYLRYVKFSPSEWKTWDDISNWYCKYFLRPQEIITSKISDKASELTRGCSTEKEKMEKIFDFVQTLRYVAIELGEGGFEPSKPQEVLKRMYGDCKDKSVLLVSLLKCAGIKAKPALVLTSDYGNVDPGFPTWTFNHMIVQARTKDGSTYWMDPTVDHCGLGELPYADQGTTALILNDDNTSTLQRIPSDKFSANVRAIQVKVDLRDPAETRFDVQMTFRGQENLVMRDFFADKTREDVEKFCKSLLADQSLNTKLLDYSFDNRDNLDSNLVFNFRMALPNELQHQGDLTFLNLDPFGLYGDWTWLARDRRKYDIQFDYPGIYYKTIEVILPKDKYSIRNLPADQMLDEDGLRYVKEYGDEGNGRILVKEVFSITRADIAAEHFQKIKDFVNSMKSAASQKIILTARRK